jgi:hypothetical protein
MRAVPFALLALLAFALSSGCISSAPTPFRLHGAFTADRTEADLREFHALVGPYASDVRIMESFPEQFAIDGKDVRQCDELSALLKAKPYVAQVGPCSATPPAGDGNAADSGYPHQESVSLGIQRLDGFMGGPGQGFAHINVTDLEDTPMVLALYQDVNRTRSPQGETTLEDDAEARAEINVLRQHFPEGAWASDASMFGFQIGGDQYRVFIARTSS